MKARDGRRIANCNALEDLISHAIKSEMGVLFMAFTAKRASLRIPGGSASQCLICLSRSMVLH